MTNPIDISKYIFNEPNSFETFKRTNQQLLMGKSHEECKNIYDYIMAKEALNMVIKRINKLEQDISSNTRLLNQTICSREYWINELNKIKKRMLEDS